MASAQTTELSPEAIKEQAWEGFVPGHWEEDIDVRDFIQKNYTPVTSRSSPMQPTRRSTCGSTSTTTTSR